MQAGRPADRQTFRHSDTIEEGKNRSNFILPPKNANITSFWDLKRGAVCQQGGEGRSGRDGISYLCSSLLCSKIKPKKQTALSQKTGNGEETKPIRDLA